MTTVSDDEFTAVASVLRHLCKDPLPDLNPSTRLDALPGMDSLKSLNAIALMEERFSIEIDLAMLDQRLDHVADIIHAIRAAIEKARIPPQHDSERNYGSVGTPRLERNPVPKR